MFGGLLLTNLNIEILCVGNELLIGKTLNTNAHWLAKRITSLGLNVKRVMVVGDNLEDISMAVKEAIQRKPIFVLVTGGLGPTFDDMTLEGVAKGLGRKTEENKEAMDMVKKRYRQYVDDGRVEKFEMTPHRVKMARLPEGATALVNTVGTAPGVLLEEDGVRMVMLPGVPSEMITIFDGSVLPMLREASGDLMFFEASLDVRAMGESQLAPMIDEVMRDNPYVYIKSHVQASEKVPYLEIHLSTTSDDPKAARQRIGRVVIQISEMIQEKGGKVKPIESQQ
jgi:molybdenum cofactor synthesis domain-containing protein